MKRHIRNLSLSLLICLLSFSVHAQWSTSGSTVYYNGRVGVGTSSMVGSADLTVKSQNTSGYGGMAVQVLGSSERPFYSYATSLGIRAWHYFDETDDAWKLYASGVRMTVKNTGNVGIGTTNPSERLEVNGNIALSGSTPTLQPVSVTGTNGKNINVVGGEGDGGGSVYITGGNDNGFNAGGMVYIQGGTGNAINGYVVIDGGHNASSGTSSDIVLGYNYGRVGVGVFYPTYKLELPNISSTEGRARANAWMTYSSRRFKENIRAVESPMKKLMDMKGVQFDWKEKNGGRADYGFVAEDLAKVLPEAIDWNDEKTEAIGVNYNAVTPVLVEALKQLQQEVDQLRNELTKARQGHEASPYGDNPENVIPELMQNQPNPFQNQTLIRFRLPESVSQADLHIYDMQGKEVKTISLNQRGEGEAVLEGYELQPGMYLYSLIADGKEIDTKRMILTR
ncbi:tail fiber domain-containing protein [Roseivirga sp. BDSF3-8]|uniref:tail fiber domain-containing protein n=1 Tax=Roseivirga sp. BDSF3-8 TaxID=3241598 RepID=UPI003531B344